MSIRRVASKLIQPKRGPVSQNQNPTEIRPLYSSGRFGLVRFLTGGLFHTCLFTAEFQEPLN
jgi:hypothetical protein